MSYDKVVKQYWGLRGYPGSLRDPFGRPINNYKENKVEKLFDVYDDDGEFIATMNEYKARRATTQCGFFLVHMENNNNNERTKGTSSGNQE